MGQAASWTKCACNTVDKDAGLNFGENNSCSNEQSDSSSQRQSHVSRSSSGAKKKNKKSSNPVQKNQNPNEVGVLGPGSIHVNL